MSQQQSFVRVATDGTGKRMATDLVSNGAQDSTGTLVDIHVQQAEIVGDVAEAINRLGENVSQLLAVQRAILAILQESSTSPATEDDFTVTSPTSP